VLESPPYIEDRLDITGDEVASALAAETTMEARIARIESDVAHLREDVSDIKQDVRALRDKLDGAEIRLDSKIGGAEQRLGGKIEHLGTRFDVLKDSLHSAKIWALALYVALAATMLGTMARGFGWI
jgi:predicted  nucleic acid-binding Zn-ribbon protein